MSGRARTAAAGYRETGTRDDAPCSRGIRASAGCAKNQALMRWTTPIEEMTTGSRTFEQSTKTRVTAVRPPEKLQERRSSCSLGNALPIPIRAWLDVGVAPLRAAGSDDRQPASKSVQNSDLPEMRNFANAGSQAKA